MKSISGKQKITLILFFFIIITSCASNIAIIKEPTYEIMSMGTSSQKDLANFLKAGNPDMNEDYITELAGLYMEEATQEGVNYDIAFCQMCLETGFQKFGGVVKPEQNNFCGLGAINSDTPGEVFPDARSGVRAHIQHLKAYASEAPLVNPVIDNRFKYVQRGVSPTIFELTGRWATDPEYGEKIKILLNRLFNPEYI